MTINLLPKLKMYNSNFDVNKLEDTGLTYRKNGLDNFLNNIKLRRKTGKKLRNSDIVIILLHDRINVQDAERAGFKIGKQIDLEPTTFTILEKEQFNLFLLLFSKSVCCYTTIGDLKNA